MRFHLKRCSNLVFALTAGALGLWLMFIHRSASTDTRSHQYIEHVSDKNRQIQSNQQLQVKQRPTRNKQQLQVNETLSGQLPSREHRQDWQSVREEHMYVYSAYHDDRQNIVIVIAIVANAKSTVKCGLWYTEKSKQVQVADATIRNIPERHGRSHTAAFIRCQLLSSATPDFVSIHMDASELEGATIESIHNLLPVTKQQANGDAKNHQFTVCVSPLHHNVSPNQLVEFIEVNRIFGADHFIFYQMSVTTSTSLQPYLDFYEGESILSMHTWSLPININSIHYNGQLAALNDCLYKSMYLSHFVVFIDLDELIVPMKTKSWAQLLSDTSLSNAAQTVGSYSFQCVFFKTEWPSDAAFMNNSFATHHNVQTLLKTKRERKIFPHRDRSKLLIIPERVKQVGVHSVHQFSNTTFSQVNVPVSTAMLFHYRNWEEPNAPVELEEKRMHSFSVEILQRLKAVHLKVNRT